MKQHIKKELEVIKSMLHDNIISYYFREQDQRFVYICLSLCQGHFGDVIFALKHFNQVKSCKNIEEAKAVPVPHFFTDPSKRKFIEMLRKEIKGMGIQTYIQRLMVGAVKGI